MNDHIATKLKIENENNKLACTGGFVEINFPPSRKVLFEDYDRIYCVNLNEKTLFVKLYDFKIVRFDDVSSVYTIPATGLDFIEWSNSWMRKYPNTNKDTPIAIYSYKFLKNKNIQD